MPDIAEHILTWPSKPQIEIDAALRSLSAYDNLKKVPSETLEKIAMRIPDGFVLTLWMRNTFVSGFEKIYSIESRDAAVATHETHKKNYRKYNPKLMKIYTHEELKPAYQ